MHCCSINCQCIVVMQCQEECEEGYHGQDCALQCHCLHGGECDPVTGECVCGPGWRGETCGERICQQEELWGLACNNLCTCHQNQTRL